MECERELFYCSKMYCIHKGKLCEDRSTLEPNLYGLIPSLYHPTDSNLIRSVFVNKLIRKSLTNIKLLCLKLWGLRLTDMPLKSRHWVALDQKAKSLHCTHAFKFHRGNKSSVFNFYKWAFETHPLIRQLIIWEYIVEQPWPEIDGTFSNSEKRFKGFWTVGGGCDYKQGIEFFH